RSASRPANGAISALVAGHVVIISPVATADTPSIGRRSGEAALGLRSRAKGAPDALRGRRHRQVGDADRGEGVEDRVHYRRCAGDRAAFADTFGAERVRGAGDGAEIDIDRRHHVGAQDAVIHQCAGQELAVVAVVEDILDQRLADALRDAVSLSICAATRSKRPISNPPITMTGGYGTLP